MEESTSTQPPRREAALHAEQVISRAANDSSDSEDTVTDLIAAGYDAAREPAPLALDARVVWHVAGFSPRRSTAFCRAGWAQWLSEDRELRNLYENTTTHKVAVFREDVHDIAGRRILWCVWDGDNRSRLAAVRADRLARRVDLLRGTSNVSRGPRHRADTIEQTRRWRGCSSQIEGTLPHRGADLAQAFSLGVFHSSGDEVRPAAASRLDRRP